MQLHLLVGDPQYDIPGYQTRETRHEAFVERGWAFLDEGLDGAVYRALVFASGAIHVTRFHDVHGTCRQGGAESCGRRGGQVTRYPVAKITASQDEILDDIVTDYLCHVHDSVSRDVRHGPYEIGLGLFFTILKK